MSGYPQQPPYPPPGYPPPPGYAAPGYPPPPGYPQQPQPTDGGGGCCSPGCCLGCVIVLLIGIIAIAGIGYYVYVGVANAAAEGVRQFAKEVVADAPIPEPQKERIAGKIEFLVNELTRLDKLIGRIQEGKFSEENLKKVVEDAMKSPIVQGLMVEVAKGKYLEESELSDEEKAQAESVWRRFIQGLVDGRISQDQAKEVLNKISTAKGDGEREFDEEISDEKLRDFIDSCKGLADNAGIPENAPEVNLADEFDRLVDGILQKF